MGHEFLITELILFISFIDLTVAEYCTHDPCDDFDTCEYGCCGSGCDTYCCDNTIGIIIGGAIAGIFICVFVAFCVWFFCVPHYKYRGQTVGTTSYTTGTTSYNTGTTYNAGSTSYNTATLVNGPGQIHMINQPAGPRFGPGYNQPGHNQPGHNQPGHNPPGYNQPGHNLPGHNPPGYNPPGYNQPGHNPPGYNQPGHNQPGHNPPGYNQAGHSQPGHNSDPMVPGGPMVWPSAPFGPIPEGGYVEPAPAYTPGPATY